MPYNQEFQPLSFHLITRFWRLGIKEVGNGGEAYDRRG